MPLGLQSLSAVRQRTRSRSSRGLDPPRRGTQRGRQTVLTDIFATGDCLRAQPIRRATGQACKGIFCADQIGFACEEFQRQECTILPIRDLAAFPHYSVCAQLKAVERSSAQWLLSVPVLLSDSRRRPDQVLWYGSSGQGRPCSGRTDSIYDSEPDLWKWDVDTMEIIALLSPDRYLSQRYNFGHGSFSESLSSLTPRPILAAPSAEVPLPVPIGSPLGEVAHTECATIMFQSTVNC